MRDKELQKRLREEKWEPDGAKMSAGRARLAAAVEQKQIMYRPSLGNLVLLQFRYMEKRFCLLQAAYFVGILICLRMLKQYGINAWDYLGVIAAASAMLGVGGILGVGRLFSNNVGELEQTCYFNLGQLASIRMLLYGVFDLFFLNVLIISAVRQTQMEWTVVALYLMTVFLVSNVCYFGLFSIIRGRGQTMALVSASLLLMLASTVPLMSPMLFMQPASLGWGVLVIGAVVALIFEIRYVLCDMTEGELLCRN